MAERFGLENIRSKCPHFEVWIEQLEKLGAELSLVEGVNIRQSDIPDPATTGGVMLTSNAKLTAAVET